MDLYYKVPKDSDTGRKFAELSERADKCTEAAAEFLEKYGFKQYRPSRISYAGGISSCCTPELDPNKKVWREIRNKEFMPRLNCKEGKEIQEEINNLPIVDIDELNNIVGYDSGGWKSSHIGFSRLNKEFFLFTISDEWKVKPPADSIEITGGEYKELQLNGD